VNEKVKDFFQISRFWLIVCAILLVWAMGGTVAAILYQRELKAVVNAVNASNGGELIDLIGQHNDTAVGVLDDIVATRIELQFATKYATELEQRIQRAYEYAESADGEFIEFRSAMGGAGNTISTLIANQQRIIEIVGRIERNNQAIKGELGMRP
jgi:hypothetical protein